MEETKAAPLVKRSWDLWGLVFPVLSIVTPTALSVAIIQGYFRYNAWVLPLLGSLTILFLVISILTLSKVRSFGREIMGVNRAGGMALLLGLLAAFLAVMTIGFCFALNKSKQHVDEARHADLAATESTLRNTEVSRSVPLPPSPGPQQGPSNAIRSATTNRPLHTVSPSTSDRSRQETPSPVPQQNSAPQGIIITGGQVENPQVNNYRPPLPEISWNQNAIATGPIQGSDEIWENNENRHESEKPGTSVVVNLRQTFYSPAFIARCNVPCRIIGQTVITGGVFYNNAGTQVRQFRANTDPTIVGVSYLQPAMFPSGTTLQFWLRSLDDRELTVTDFVASYAP
jgi:hypothetical protein